MFSKNFAARVKPDICSELLSTRSCDPKNQHQVNEKEKMKNTSDRQSEKNK